MSGVFSSAIGWRVATEALATAAYLTALTKLPLAGLTAVIQIAPLAVTFVAARVLREPVSPHRVAAVSAGFVGVLLIVRPWSDDFSPWYLLGFSGRGADRDSRVGHHKGAGSNTVARGGHRHRGNDWIDGFGRHPV